MDLSPVRPSDHCNGGIMDSLHDRLNTINRALYLRQIEAERAECRRLNRILRMKQTIRGTPVSQLSPKAVAGQFYRDGEGHDSNPYPKGSNEYDAFMLEMGRLHDLEMRGLLEELRAKI